ncbi:hypothetical protein Cst04h_07950 [Corynebacterium striatum]|uniref:Uncharacterized protein n=1 Tax=Corynebacterium striatum TaxID=43770 RepID=A0ABC9ZKA4_CORST|nr:hypothetical protein HMPREF0308_1928 [Corynebacterium striatum ATCC 6940]GEA42625.1 hypothetical protein Cst04h_07950 [Corynebacterium striatum]GKH15922.1 hypothetical protein CE91St29_02350 [Corynebacterium striatum]
MKVILASEHATAENRAYFMNKTQEMAKLRGRRQANKKLRLPDRRRSFALRESKA